MHAVKLDCLMSVLAWWRLNSRPASNTALVHCSPSALNIHDLDFEGGWAILPLQDLRSLWRRILHKAEPFRDLNA